MNLDAKLKRSHLDAIQGAAEERPQVYYNTSRTYRRRATQQCAKNNGKVTALLELNVAVRAFKAG
ncbi:hypothetical protein KW794_03170 [Candidatus Saccharibacteria bacterium]|nr:hypothetical protein [Candidatus Saccharibacteria bacterium]